VASSNSPRDVPDQALRILDVGCGNGEFVSRMRRFGWDGDGIDIDASAVEIGRIAGLKLKTATLADLVRETPAARFDAIALDHVLEHLYDPVESLRDARKLLNPGGFLWIATPNLSALGHRAFRRAWMPLDPPRHLVLFSPGALRTALASAGFAVQSQQPAARTACWVFALSAAPADRPNRLVARARLSVRLMALLADLVARGRPALAEELVFVARPQPA
jgi:2-polyprenyl-3-methyl-5-hydroxy-6-metoxy-1,4-benzoquinol methylase